MQRSPPNGSPVLPPEAFFSGPGLNRADLLRPNAEALRALAAQADARELRWQDGLPALTADGTLSWQPVRTPDLFLGLAEDGPRFSAIPDGSHDFRAQFATLSLLGPAEAPLFAAALSLGNWHRRHRFCANCGSASGIVRGGWSRRCPTCAAEHFPRVDPVVIMLAEHDGQVLLGRQPQYPPGRYSALAGFVEVGETIEAAVARELGEEAGIAVADVRYVASQPWPFPSSLMIGCTARALGAELTVDTTELDDARWFTRTEVIAALADEAGAAFLPPPPYAIARTLLEHWLHA
ncbi:NAD(+) diphosphatase [uncultured Sphingomonas sp.]|uniref:NAD(+) diphosphatase n=1 Tax=uncultured Sphingomonas sp. TaxID=158754 RepID=UPI0025ED3C3A|nr:NAD(+) diphosphatase [uncultured Sphingomonas sp.]